MRSGMARRYWFAISSAAREYVMRLSVARQHVWSRRDFVSRAATRDAFRTLAASRTLQAMITLMKVKDLLQDQSMSDEEAERIRDACYCMAELVFEAWKVDRSTKTGR